MVCENRKKQPTHFLEWVHIAKTTDYLFWLVKIILYHILRNGSKVTRFINQEKLMEKWGGAAGREGQV